MSTKMIRSLMSFYATPDLPTQDEALAAAAKVLAERTAAQDKIDLREHDRRYHGGQYETGDPCPLRDKITKMEETMGKLDPKDADGDGNADFPNEDDGEEDSKSEAEDAATNYLQAVIKGGGNGNSEEPQADDVTQH